MDKISVIVPCYNEEMMIEMFHKSLDRVISAMPGTTFEIIFVNDGSKDNTQKKLEELAERDLRVYYISFSRNFGKEAAMYAGITHATGDYTVIMDADLQHPPELIPQMYNIIRTGSCDCVATRRISRDNEPPVRSAFAHLFYNIFNKLCHLDVVDGAMDFRMMTRQMTESIAAMPEHGRFSKGIFSWVGFRTEWLEYKNIERAAGETKWSFLKLLLYAIEGFTSFSYFPLHIPTIFGGTVFGLSAIAGIVTLIMHLTGTAVSGVWTIILVMLLLFGIQFMMMGVLGEYTAKIYLEAKNRPQFIIKNTNIGSNVERGRRI